MTDKNKKLIIIVSLSFVIIILNVLSFICGYDYMKRQKTIIVHTDFDIEDIKENEVWKYNFMPKQYSDYIVNLSTELNIDPDLVVAILMRENPEFNPEARHFNESNGTTDLGLMQLNDRYIWTVFVPAYWDLDINFNPYNWKHNLFLSMHHIKYLEDTLKIQDDVICAYNGGKGAVMNGTLKPSTYNYLAGVKNNLKLLKETKQGELE